jgi:hypothetical protein
MLVNRASNVLTPARNAVGGGGVVRTPGSGFSLKEAFNLVGSALKQARKENDIINQMNADARSESKAQKKRKIIKEKLRAHRQSLGGALHKKKITDSFVAHSGAGGLPVQVKSKGKKSKSKKACKKDKTKRKKALIWSVVNTLCPRTIYRELHNAAGQADANAGRQSTFFLDMLTSAKMDLMYGRLAGSTFFNFGLANLLNAAPGTAGSVVSSTNDGAQRFRRMLISKAVCITHFANALNLDLTLDRYLFECKIPTDLRPDQYWAGDMDSSVPIDSTDIPSALGTLKASTYSWGCTPVSKRYKFLNKYYSLVSHVTYEIPVGGHITDKWSNGSPRIFKGDQWAVDKTTSTQPTTTTSNSNCTYFKGARIAIYIIRSKDMVGDNSVANSVAHGSARVCFNGYYEFDYRPMFPAPEVQRSWVEEPTIAVGDQRYVNPQTEAVNTVVGVVK